MTYELQIGSPEALAASQTLTSMDRHFDPEQGRDVACYTDMDCADLRQAYLDELQGYEDNGSARTIRLRQRIDNLSGAQARIALWYLADQRLVEDALGFGEGH